MWQLLIDTAHVRNVSPEACAEVLVVPNQQRASVEPCEAALLLGGRDPKIFLITGSRSRMVSRL